MTVSTKTHVVKATLDEAIAIVVYVGLRPKSESREFYSFPGTERLFTV